MGANPLNRAEEFVSTTVRKSFLSLWTYANPRGKKGRELCDVLVVCEPHVIILSVKEVKVGNSGSIATDWERWRREAVDASAAQIYGAERWIKTATKVTRKDGTPGLPFPKFPERRIHRIAVALGAHGRVPLKYGDLGRGFVHVLDDVSFEIVLSELDTISDFVEYLSAKERLADSTEVLHCGEEDLLGLYLSRGRSFPTEPGLLVVDDTIWKAFSHRPEYLNKRLADKPSYSWDRLVEEFSRHALAGSLEFGNTLTEAERVVRVMARENRFSRRCLGEDWESFLRDSRSIRSRMVKSPSRVVYVFLAAAPKESREFRKQELTLRCFVARGLNPGSRVTIGIATEQRGESPGHSLDAALLDLPDWTRSHQVELERIQSGLGYFTKPRQTERSVDEFPSTAEP
jgi:hypothetical protein